MLNAKKTQKSPLTYPNDKPLAVSVIAEHIPLGQTSITTPFLGGGSIELGLAARGYKVTAYTEYRLLYDFWQCIQMDPGKLYQMASSFYPVREQKLFSMLQKKVYQPDDEFLRSALFYVLNHCSEQGSTTGGRLDPGTPHFNEMRLNQLASFEAQPFTLELESYTTALDAGNYLVCAMPEYIKSNLAAAVVIPERPQLNHKKFAKMIKSRDVPGWILLYKYNKELLELYSGSEILMFTEAYRPTSNPDRAEEVLIIGS